MLFIGTSGWVYKDWKSIFYPEDLSQKNWLSYYCQNFNSVEVNSTFYHSMRPQIFKNWRQSVGKSFTFALKASRYITHIKRLKNCKNEVKRLIDLMNNINPPAGGKSVILFQLASNFKADPNRLNSFLSFLPLKIFRYAFEFRHPSWFDKEIYKSLKKANTAFVIQDSPTWPTKEIATADFTYLRFHGSQSLYSSCYTKKELKLWLKKIKNWQQKKRDFYIYFNNDTAGYAVKNAKTLKNLLK